MPKIKQTYPHKPIIDIDTLANIFDTIMHNLGGTPARNGRSFITHISGGPAVFIQYLSIATPLCYEYETYFNKRDNNTFKLTYPPTGEHITIEFICDD